MVQSQCGECIGGASSAQRNWPRSKEDLFSGSTKRFSVANILCWKLTWTCSLCAPQCLPLPSGAWSPLAWAEVPATRVTLAVSAHSGGLWHQNRYGNVLARRFQHSYSAIRDIYSRKPLVLLCRKVSHLAGTTSLMQRKEIYRVGNGVLEDGMHAGRCKQTMSFTIQAHHYTVVKSN